MTRLLVSSTVAMMFASSAAVFAQDMSGPYVGGHLGSVNVAGDYTAFTPRNSFAGFDLQGLDASQGTAGVQMGYNWDQGSYVLGIEGSASFFGLQAVSTTSDAEGSVPEFGRTVDNLVTVMPKIGVKAGNGLIYAKAGLAMATVGAWHDQDPIIEGSGSASGWALGVGAEFPIAPQWTGRIDYTYADFGSVRTDMVGSPDIWTTQNVNAGLISVGVNYYFN
jgi:outer membrane immunogenic protein